MRLRGFVFGIALVPIAAPGYAQVRTRGSFGGNRGPLPTPPSVVAPYRFSSPSTTMAPADQQEMLNYRSQLQGQEQQLENTQTEGRLGPLGRQELRDTQSEINRLNNSLQP